MDATSASNNNSNIIINIVPPITITDIAHILK